MVVIKKEMRKQFKLIVSTDEALERLTLQLTRGSTISKFTIGSISDFDIIKDRYEEWHDVTKSLLEIIDKNLVLVDDFHYLTPTMSSGNEGLTERVNHFRFMIKKDLNNLKSIYNKISLEKSIKTKKKVKKHSFPKKSKTRVDAHFFFMDVVSLSDSELGSTEEQIDKINAMNNLIKSCKIFSSTKNQRYIQPTGDGMVIGFTNDVSAPLDLAIEFHEKIQKYNKTLEENKKLNVRIGIHSAPVLLFLDISGAKNVWGEGIIIASRVMSLGESNHILLSSKTAEELSLISTKYKKILHKIGSYPIKHGSELEVYSVYADGFGNKTKPKIDMTKLKLTLMSDRSKIKSEIKLLKLRKKTLIAQRQHEIALYEEDFQLDLSAYRLTLTKLHSLITEVEEKIAEKTELLKTM